MTNMRNTTITGMLKSTTTDSPANFAVVTMQVSGRQHATNNINQ